MHCLIYVYGNHERGMGHVYQSYALSCALKDTVGAQTTFVVLDHPEGLRKFRQWGLEVIDIPCIAPRAEQISLIERQIQTLSLDAVVVDILESPPDLMAYFRQKTECLVSIDDLGEGRFHADLLFNVIHHPPRLPGAQYTELTDLRYVILREAFAQAHQLKRISPVRFGGFSYLKVEAILLAAS